MKFKFPKLKKVDKYERLSDLKDKLKEQVEEERELYNLKIEIEELRGDLNAMRGTSSNQDKVKKFMNSLKDLADNIIMGLNQGDKYV